MRVLVPDYGPFQELSVPEVEIVTYAPGETPAGEADGLVLWMVGRDEAKRLMETRGLRWVLTLTAGIDHVKGGLPDGVTLYNANALHDRAVAVHVVTGLLGAARGLHRFRDLQRDSQWARLKPDISGLYTLDGQKVVIWGYGHIGKIVEELLTPFGAKIYGLTSKTEADLVEVRLQEADWIILLLPSTERTRGIVNAELLSTLKKGVWLSNQGRGNLIVNDDLLSALRSGQVGGAILDVTDPEPLPAEHPLWREENVIITPHVAGMTMDMYERGAAYTRNFLLMQSQGQEPEGRVDMERGY